ncbi:MAG: pyridoxamine 5'-phosphate oxidase family protein [Treponema sp.]|nr:pyridoxamine 5'-phosphate oxidase family protein [Treponema sp.]
MKPMRRKDREIPRDEALAVVDKCAFSIMATINPDGSPYCIPLSIARDGDHLYFHCAYEGHKVDNLNHSNRVCISCVGEVKPYPGDFSLFYESAVINGTATEVTDREEKLRALRLISERFTPDHMSAFDEYVGGMIEKTMVYRVHIDEISGKARRA